MLRHKIYSALTQLVDKPAKKLTAHELELINRLKVAFKSFKVYPLENLSASELEWAKNMNRLRELVLTDNPAEFLRWDVILYTMFVSGGRMVSAELNYLKKDAQWSRKWKNVLKEDDFGRPLPYLFYPSSSGNRITHAYHLARFEAATRTNLEETDFIFEFGGGYGSLCRIIHKAGFKGRYLIYDLPPFSALQEFYLSSLELPLLSFTEFKSAASGIYCTSDSDELKQLTGNYVPTEKNNLFIATWSLSESPLHVREFIVPQLENFNQVLIGFQDKFGEMENKDWFARFMQRWNNFLWVEATLDFPEGNNYLFGKSAK